MRLVVCSVGRLRASPERDLCDRYLKRARGLGPGLGFAAIDEREVAEGRAARVAERQRTEARHLLLAAPLGAAVLAFDERGTVLDSPAFAALLARDRDGGAADLALLIGGPDGLSPEVRAGARRVVSLGAMTWPHPIAKLLVHEQIYRALTILAGHPYHRA